MTYLSFTLIGCIGGCDDVLKELTEMSRFQHHNQTTMPGLDVCPRCLFHTWADCCARPFTVLNKGSVWQCGAEMNTVLCLLS